MNRRRVVGAALLLPVLVVSGCSQAAPSHQVSDGCASAAPQAVAVTSALLNSRADPAPHRVPVALNGLVQLRVSTDKAVEVHVHGYDFAYEAQPGTPGCVSFVADMAGLFDVEAHPDTLLVQLEVR
jgi:hypothetical protein